MSALPPKANIDRERMRVGFVRGSAIKVRSGAEPQLSDKSCFLEASAMCQKQSALISPALVHGQARSHADDRTAETAVMCWANLLALGDER